MIRIGPAIVVTLALVMSAPAPGREVLQWHELPSIPDEVGFGGPFAGTSLGALIVAGGANFPDGPPWHGHARHWHDRIFVLPSPDGQWIEAATKLPRPLAYGVSIAGPDGLVCIGGSSPEGHRRDVFLLRWSTEDIEIESLPALPYPLANACGAIVGQTIYVAGGIERPDATEATRHFLSLDLNSSDPRWCELDPWPGAERMLAVAGAHGNAFYLFSGARLVAHGDGVRREYLTDAYRYTPGKGWERIADLPRAAVAAPSPAALVGGSHLLILGGDDGALVDFEPRDKHPGFPDDILAYHAITDTWVVLGKTPAPLVTTPLVGWQGGFVVPGGEIRPAVRSTDVQLAIARQQQARFGTLNYLSLVLYLAAIVGIGVWFTRRNRSTDQFLRAGQRIPWWAAGLSIYATMLSSITYMAVPAHAFAGNWTYYMNAVAIVLMAPLVVYAYLPFFRQLDVTSAYEYLERRFNLPVRLFASASFMLFQLGRVAIVLFLPALALATVSEIDIYLCILIMGVLCIVYTVLGGIEAVIWTDVVQSIVLLMGAGAAFVIIMTSVEGGLTGVISIARDQGKFFRDVSFGWDTAAATMTVVLVGSLFQNLISYTSSQDVVQRYLTTSSQRLAARSIWTNAVISLPSAGVFFLLGSALFVFYKTDPQRLDPTIHSDALFPLFIMREMPAPLAGVVVAGIFAAAQSTLSSSMNSVAAAYVTDFHRRLLPGRSDRGNLLTARVVTVLVGIIGVGVASYLAYTGMRGMWDAFLRIIGLFGGALAGLFALGIFTTRASGPGALFGAIVSAIVLYLVQRLTSVNFFLYGAIGVLTCFFTGYLASWVIPATSKPLAGLTLFTTREQSQPVQLAINNSRG